MDVDDLAGIEALEASLWRPDSRFDRAHLERVLHPDFEEVGASGRRWSRAETVAMPAEAFETVLPLSEFRVASVAPDTALTAYRSETRFGDGSVRRAERSSLRLRDAEGWRLRFHQGTPVA